jgi:hypothetical protein
MNTEPSTPTTTATADPSTRVPLPPPPVPPFVAPSPGPSDPAPRGRIAWIVVGGLLAVAALGWGTFSVVGVLAHEERTERTVIPSAGIVSIVVVNDDGSVRIEAGTGGEIIVSSRISEGLQSPSTSMQVLDGRLVLRSSCPSFGSIWCSVDRTVAVPPGIDVTVESDDGRVAVVGPVGAVDVSSNHGSVTIDGARGDLRVRTGQGSIRAISSTAGTVVARSGQGSISLTFTAPPNRVDVQSGQGSIDVTVPDDGTEYVVDADAGLGRVEIGVPTDPDAERTIVARSGLGSIRVHTSG